MSRFGSPAARPVPRSCSLALAATALRRGVLRRSQRERVGQREPRRAPGIFRRPSTSRRPCSRATPSGCAAARTSATTRAASTAPSSSPIIVRQYAGERATLDGNDGTSNVTLLINGSYAWFWGFEVMNSNPNRISSNTSPPPNRGEGTNLLGVGTKLINMIIHDTDQGTLTTANTNEVYGNLIYYNGYSGTDRGHGHGIYAQHQGTTTEADPRQHHLRPVRLRDPRLHGGRQPRLSRLPGKHLLQQRRHLAERLDHQHPRRRPAGRHEPHPDRQLHVQLRSRTARTTPATAPDARTRRSAATISTAARP